MVNVSDKIFFAFSDLDKIQLIKDLLDMNELKLDMNKRMIVITGIADAEFFINGFNILYSNYLSVDKGGSLLKNMKIDKVNIYD